MSIKLARQIPFDTTTEFCSLSNYHTHGKLSDPFDLVTTDKSLKQENFREVVIPIVYYIYFIQIPCCDHGDQNINR